jgi:3-(3-hydroxy-phenyl)propionate hydroxylase
MARDNGGKARGGKITGGTGFTLLYFAGDTPVPQAVLNGFRQLAGRDVPVKAYVVADSPVAGQSVIEDGQGKLAARYDGRPGTCYLLRPDHHVAARWRQFDEALVARALDRALGR